MLGGVGLLLALIPILNVLGALAALVGVVLGVIGLLQHSKAKLTAIIGLPISILSLALSVVLVVVYAVAFTEVVGTLDTLEDDDGSYVNAEQEPVVFEPGSTEPADGDLGLSPSNPAPFGSTVRFGPDDMTDYGWEVSLGSPTLDVTAEVAAAYPYPDLEPGEQYASVPVTVTNLGWTRATPAVQLKFEYVTSGLQRVEKRWINMEGTIETLGGVEPEASETGNVIIDIPTVDADRGVWGVRFYLSSQTVYFGMPPGN